MRGHLEPACAVVSKMAPVRIFLTFRRTWALPRPIFWCSYERIWTICPSSSIIAPRLRSLVEITLSYLLGLSAKGLALERPGPPASSANGTGRVRLLLRVPRDPRSARRPSPADRCLARPRTPCPAGARPRRAIATGTAVHVLPARCRGPGREQTRRRSRLWRSPHGRWRRPRDRSCPAAVALRSVLELRA